MHAEVTEGSGGGATPSPLGPPPALAGVTRVVYLVVAATFALDLALEARRSLAWILFAPFVLYATGLAWATSRLRSSSPRRAPFWVCLPLFLHALTGAVTGLAIGLIHFSPRLFKPFFDPWGLVGFAAMFCGWMFVIVPVWRARRTGPLIAVIMLGCFYLLVFVSRESPISLV